MANLRSSLSQETPESVSQASNSESPRNPVFDCNCNNISEPFMFSYGGEFQWFVKTITLHHYTCSTMPWWWQKYWSTIIGQISRSVTKGYINSACILPSSIAVP
jgi:hypothetical protein